MIYFLTIIFSLCLFLPVYTYVVYPFVMKQRAKSIKIIKNNYDVIEYWPPITIVFSVYNEDKVIQRKLESIVKTNYPLDKIQILIGSDNSTDSTHQIIEDFQQNYKSIKLIKFEKRQGKLKIINQLIDLVDTEYVVFTDANVFFEPQTFKALVYNLVVQHADLVCGNIHKFSPKNEGISDQEIFYMNFENQLKYHESVYYNFIVGVEGGCYAIKKNSFVKVPDGFLMDDFFITLDVISKKGKVLFEPEALCYEDVNDTPMIEYKRKVRISLGNFRNLHYYKQLLFPIYKDFGFAFFSHKVCRWFVPFALIFSFLVVIPLTCYYSACSYLLSFYSLLIILPVLTVYLEKINIKLPFVNTLGHFILMNAALFMGYIKYQFASTESAWEPPKRNV